MVKIKFNGREIELKRCPFCGGLPVMDEEVNDTRVYCMTCGVMIFDEEEERAISIWNHRYQPPEEEATEEKED